MNHYMNCNGGLTQVNQKASVSTSLKRRQNKQTRHHNGRCTVYLQRAGHLLTNVLSDTQTQFTLSPLLRRRWALVSPDGVVPSQMVSVSASVNLSLHNKVQKFSSGTGSPGWSRKQQQQQPFYGPLLGTTQVSRYQKKHSATHHPGGKRAIQRLWCGTTTIIVLWPYHSTTCISRHTQLWTDEFCCSKALLPAKPARK